MKHSVVNLEKSEMRDRCGWLEGVGMACTEIAVTNSSGKSMNSIV